MEKVRVRQRGLTFVEVLIASAVLLIVLLVALQGTATTQVTVNDTNDQAIAENTANNIMQFLLETTWLDNYDAANPSRTYPSGAAPGILNYLHGNVKLSPTSAFVPGTLTPFPVPVPGYPAANTIGTFWVTEATATDCPGYGNSPRYNGALQRMQVRFQPSTSPFFNLVPYAPPNAPTVLELIVQVNIPPFASTQTPYPGAASTRAATAGRPPTFVQLRSLRSSL
jgi:prepilin-type N-terminal cleavage/methylation domain-containing protein